MVAACSSAVFPHTPEIRFPSLAKSFATQCHCSRRSAARLARISHSSIQARRDDARLPKIWTPFAHGGAFSRTRTVEAPMNQQAVVSKFSHVKPGDTEFKGGGLRDFFLYRDLGIADATGGQVICHLVKANPDLPPEEGTGWHKHECEFQIVIMTKGWARFMYEDKSTLVQAGDVVHQRPGITHYLYDYSEDMEYLEIVSPADFKTVDVAPFVDNVPPPTPWK
jgi:mannose-6-phosphate isomerase-like protein (cupin superfamily)